MGLVVRCGAGYNSPTRCESETDGRHAMKDDPIVDEVRKAGEAYLAQFNFDMKTACDDLRKRSEAAGRKTVSLPPRPVKRHGAGRRGRGDAAR